MQTPTGWAHRAEQLSAEGRLDEAVEAHGVMSDVLQGG